MRQVELRRIGKTIAPVDLYDYPIHRDMRSDVRLKTGDVVSVPGHRTRAKIASTVRRQDALRAEALKELLRNLLQATGGFRANADLRRIAVHRLLPMPER
jgi:hypothetical protein